MTLRTSKIVYDARIARELLRLGYTIIDIKPDKYDKDKKRTIFVFNNDESLEKDIYDISEKYRIK